MPSFNHVVEFPVLIKKTVNLCELESLITGGRMGARGAPRSRLGEATEKGRKCFMDH